MKNKILTHTTLIGAISLLVLIATSLPAFAQTKKDKDEESIDETGPVVRRRLLYRSTRLEVAPMLGMTVADAFNRNLIGGANVNFHLTNEIGIGLTAGFGLTQLSTSLRDNVEALPQLNDKLRDIEYSYIKWLVGVEGSYVPTYGKFALLTDIIVNYDFHLIGGVAFVGEGALNAQTGEDVPDSSIAGGRVAPTLGVGMRFYAGDMISINLDVRDYIFSRTLVNQSGAESELTNNVLVTFGVSFFLPGTLKVSR